MAYIVKADIETFLNLTLSVNGQALVDTLIPAVEKFAEDYTGRKWSIQGNTDIIETFDGGDSCFFPVNIPIASIQSITVGGSLLASTAYYNYGSYVKLASRAPDVPQTVVITYRTSANSLPADLKHALIQWIAQIFKSQDDAGKVASRVSAGSVSIDYLVKDGIPMFVKMLLDKYKVIVY